MAGEHHLRADVPARFGLGGRIVLGLITLWALALVVPDFLRVAHPLGSMGFGADNSGLIYDVQGSFNSPAASPAWRAGLRPGERIDFAAMRCVPLTAPGCASLLAVVGGGAGEQLVLPDLTIVLRVLGSQGRARTVRLTAAIPEVGRLDRFVLLLNEIAAVPLILGAAWLVWTRPGPMTWGFFLYEAWFNPGQTFVFYALLQQWPAAMLVEEVLQALAVGAGYGGFLIFALRAPRGTADPGWRLAERAVLPLSVMISVLRIAAFSNALGLPTEMLTRAGFLMGYTVNLAALGVLLRRRRRQPPEDYQRLRWVIWGCVIGLPAFIFADSNAVTTLWLPVWGNGGPSDAVLGVCYLANGVLAGFVLEAVRRKRVIDVAIPLRRITLLMLLVSIPVFWLGEKISAVQDAMDLPGWAWLGLGGAVAVGLGRVHEATADVIHHVLDPTFRRAHHHFRHARAALTHSGSVAAIEHLLVEAPMRALRLSSAAVFRMEAEGWERREAVGWPETDAVMGAAAREAAAACLRSERPHRLRHALTEAPGLPHGLAAPCVCLPVGDGLAIVLYGPHRTGADLNLDEREMLAAFVEEAARAYAHQEIRTLRRRVAELEGRRQGKPQDFPHTKETHP